MAKSDSFVFYRSFFEAMQNVDDEIGGQVFKAICMYALDGKTPKLTGVSSALFTLIKPQIDANRKRREAGSKGGQASVESRRKASNNLQPNFEHTSNNASKQNQANVNVNVNDNVNVNYNANENPNENSNVVVTDTTQQIPSLDDVKAHMVSIGFAETSAELTSSDFYTYNQKRCWSFLGSARWQDKLMDWICKDYKLKEEYDAIQKRKAKEQEEAERERLRWEEFDAKYYDNHPNPFSIVQNADDFVTYIRGNKHFQFDDDTCKKMDHFFLDEELIQMYEDGAVNTDEQYGSCIKYLYACGQCKELIEHFNHGHERAYRMDPFVWKSREEEQEEIEKLNAARKDEFAYEEEEYDDLPFS